MTTKGVFKLLKQPHVFVKDYAKKRFIKEELKNYVIKAIDIDVPSDKYYYFLARELRKEKYNFRAEKAIQKAISRKPKSIYYYELALILKSRWQWWQIVDALKLAIELGEPKVEKEWYLFYVEALEKMSFFEEAIEVFEKLDKRGELTSDNYFLYGTTLQKLGEEDKASSIFQKALEKSNKKEYKEFGLGAFYQDKGDWVSANRAYIELVKKNEVVNPELLYREALSFDRSYCWEEAVTSYKKAISLRPYNLYWYYRLGFVSEHLKNWNEAINAYSFVAFQGKHNSDYFYRLGYVLDKAEKYEEACEAFLMMKKIKLNGQEEEPLSKLESIANHEVEENIELLNHYLEKNTIETPFWYALGNKADGLKYWRVAEYGYREHLVRKETFDSNLYFLLANVLVKEGRFQEASRTFLKQKIIQGEHGTPTTEYDKNSNFRKLVNYTEYYETLGVEKKTVLYESYHASSISCNPYAIFKEIYKDERFNEYRHIWVLNDKTKIPKELKSDANIVFISRNSDLYMRYLATAEYLINNVSFPEYFIKKEDQYYLNTWHGTPIKSLGKDIKDSFIAHKNVTRNFLQASHLIQPNEYTKEILLGRYDVKDTVGAIVAKTGYPRQDLMLNVTDSAKGKLRKKLNISQGKKVILYAPTWRGLHGTAEFDTQKLELDIEKIKTLENVHFLFRGHHMIEGLLKKLKIGNSIVASDIDTNTLLSIVDVLITDYSSIAFDYMAMEKPIIYYTYDREEYEAERGLYFPLEELGGEICNSSSELITTLKNTLNSDKITVEQKEAQLKFCSYDDGKATQRVIDLFFFNKKENIDIVDRVEKISILFYGGSFIPNGITTSFINLLNHIDRDKYIITIVLEPNLIAKDEKKLEQIAQLDNDVSIIGYTGTMLTRLEEKWVIGKFGTHNDLSSLDMWDVYQSSYRREFKRIFGAGRFDSIINFEGYNTFWTAIFSVKNHNIKRNTIYLHNDMYGEWKLRFPYLEKNFRLYKYYDALAPVSEKTMELNIENLMNKFSLRSEQFIYCDNIQNPKKAFIKAEEQMKKEDEKIFKDTRVFINIARLSPEKDQEKLIRAFSEVSKKYSNARLVNLGSGPLENHLHQLIKELNLEKRIFFLGQRLNPYPYLKRAECFILSSNHEGQPMTLFEALILKKTIIATDIVGNRSVLEGRPGLLVENSKEGLIQGMLNVLGNSYVEENTFDALEYNQNALNMFYTKVVGA